MDPRLDHIDKDVRMFLLAADGAANRGDWEKSDEYIAKARALTEKRRQHQADSVEDLNDPKA